MNEFNQLLEKFEQSIIDHRFAVEEGNHAEYLETETKVTELRQDLRTFVRRNLK